MRNGIPNLIEMRLLALLNVEATGKTLCNTFVLTYHKPIDPSTLYTELRRMRQFGWIKTRREKPDRRLVFFRITAEGSTALSCRHKLNTIQPTQTE